MQLAKESKQKYKALINTVNIGPSMTCLSQPISNLARLNKKKGIDFLSCGTDWPFIFKTALTNGSFDRNECVILHE